MSRVKRLFNALGQPRRWLRSEWAGHPVRLMGFILLILSVGFGLLDLLPGKFFQDFAANISTELASIALTVLIIDRLNERRQDQLRRQIESEQQQREQALLRASLIRDLRSGSNPFAIRAAQELRHHGWLQDGSLAGIDLTDAQLEKANLSNANLEGAVLTNANLKEANLDGANLNYADLSGANLQQAQLRGARLNEARLRGCNLQEATLREAELRASDIMFADLRGASLNWAKLEEAKFIQSKLAKAALHGAILRNANLEYTDLQEASLQGANLKGAKLSGTKLMGANLRGAQLQGANFDFPNLHDADLTMANLQDAIFYSYNILSDAANLDNVTMPDGRQLEGINNRNELDLEKWLDTRAAGSR